MNSLPLSRPDGGDAHDRVRTSPPIPGAATDGVRTLLRLESLAMLALLLTVYHALGASWRLFAVLLLMPDLAMLPYIWSKTGGAIAYNATHAYIGPAVLGAVGLAVRRPHGSTLLAIATIWAAHIALDRVLGYGLKYRTGFGDTHLGRVGRDTRPN